MADVLSEYEALFARAFASRDPVAVLRHSREDPSASPELREMLAGFDEDGARLSGLIVTRLRFERLLQGSRAAAEWFESDPRAFTAAFKSYQDAVSPRGSFAADEARAFERWRSSRGGAGT